MSQGRRPRVVIVGAGFGGLWAARHLSGAAVDVLLIDRNNFHTFLPLLYQVAAAELDAPEILYPVRAILRKMPNVDFAMAEVTGIDLDRRLVHTHGAPISYEYLVLATGSVPHYFGVPGAQEHAFPLRSLEQAIDLRNHIVSRFERAAREADPGCRRRAVTFAIVGGGATGVEFAGALAELIRGPVRKDYPLLDPGEVSVILLEGQDRLLTGLPERLGGYALRRLRAMRVEVRLCAPVTEVAPDALHLRDGTTTATETVVWTAGVRGDPDAGCWGLPTGRGGRVPVEPTLQVRGRPEVYVIGDLAYLEDQGAPLPMVAPVATQQGRHAAKNILRQVARRAPEPFDYRDPGMLATIGRNAAVAYRPGFAFTGFPAWVLWLAIHIVKLIGFRNRLIVLINWAWDYFFYERAVRLVLPLKPAPTRQVVEEALPPAPRTGRAARAAG
ncbi:MAG: NAD(P)/FAD-dependent oxidoreductase [Gemmatimonadetes bacterium]|nr:NAD(P)/FAD-dependent oxidoreductase [Gemmatimonadota bacterium]